MRGTPEVKTAEDVAGEVLREKAEGGWVNRPFDSTEVRVDGSSIDPERDRAYFTEMKARREQVHSHGDGDVDVRENLVYSVPFFVEDDAGPVVNPYYPISGLERDVMIRSSRKRDVVSAIRLEENGKRTPEETDELLRLRASIHADYVKAVQRAGGRIQVHPKLREAAQTVPEGWREWAPSEDKSGRDSDGNNGTGKNGGEMGHKPMTDEEIAQARMNIAVPNQSLDPVGGDGEGGGGETGGDGRGGGNRRDSGEGGRGDGTPPPPDGGNGERKEDDDEEPLEEPYWGTPFDCDSCGGHNDGGLKCGSCHGVRKDVRDNPEIMRDIQNFEGEYYAAMDALAEDGDVGLLIDWMAEYRDRGYMNRSVRRNVMREIRRSGRYDEYVGKRDEVIARRASRGGGDRDGGGNEQVRVEIPIGQAREVFMERVHQVLFFTEGDIKVVRPEDVDRILREIGAPEVFRKEAYAFAAIMNQSGIKRHFSDNPKPLFDQLDKVDLQAAPVGDVEKIRLMLHGYQDRYWLDMLAAQDPRAKENISQAWMWFSYIGEGDDRGVPAGQEWLSAYIQEYGEKGVKNQEFEDGMVRRVAGMLGISEYEARVAFMCWEATMESEVNKRHPFYGLTHPIEHAEGLRTHSRIWWGSEGWWRVPDVKGGRINGMPARLWRPVGYGGGNGVGVAERVLTGSGVEAFLHDLQDRGRRRGEGLFDGNLRDLMTIAAKAHKRLTDIGPGTPTAKFEPKMLWGLKESLSTLVSKGYVGMDEAKRALEAASMVYFYEMSVEAPNYDKVEDRVLRVMSPAAMMRKFMDLALLGEDLVVDGGNWRVVERGLFDFGDGDEGLDRLRRVRGLAWGYMREFYDNRRYWHLLPDNQNQKGIMGSLKFGMVTDYIENQQELYRLLKKADKKNPRAWLSDRWGLT